MILRRRDRWIQAGLATIVLTSVCGGVATAAPVGLTIASGTLTPVSDPQYVYTFDIQLGAGATLIQNLSYITVYDLPDIPPGTGTTQPNQFWGATEQFQGITPGGFTPVPPDSPTVENVTWYYNGPTFTNNSSVATDIGLFTIGPTTTLTSPPPPITLTYVSSLDGVTASNSGTVTVSVVPEPSSIVLLLVGAAGIIVPALLRRG
jgi:hypothetical protein